MKKRVYSKEFKEQAVRLSHQRENIKYEQNGFFDKHSNFNLLMYSNNSQNIKAQH
ncbi:MAG: hypothetical protein ACX93O_11375 [Flagellimonas sp.]